MTARSKHITSILLPSKGYTYPLLLAPPCDLSSFASCLILLNGQTAHGVQLENWVFESDKPDAELKLIDFGLSTYFGKVRVSYDTLAPLFLPTRYMCMYRRSFGVLHDKAYKWQLDIKSPSEVAIFVVSYHVVS